MIPKFIRRINEQANQRVHVWWETTCHPFHASGPEREEGKFETNELRARSWAQRFVHRNPMGMVRITRI